MSYGAFIEFRDVSKKFCRSFKKSLWYGLEDIAAELSYKNFNHELREAEFWALKNINFTLQEGEALGLVGRNGAGKTTLLRILSGLIRPDCGSITVRGKVAPLIALGAGFNPLLSGRENIYVNMSILGLTKNQIEERFDAVINFAEIGEAIDSPVQSYSSGMAARLGFASAIHTNPDILLIDEVLAVGDMQFRAKCYRHLSKLRSEGTTFILVSHDPNAILSVCSSAIYLDNGKIVASGEVNEIMSAYENHSSSINQESASGHLTRPSRPKDLSPGIDIVSVYFRNRSEEKILSPTCGEKIYICVGIIAHKHMEDVEFGILIHDHLMQGDRVLRLSSSLDGQKFNLNPGKHELYLKLPSCNLRPSLYTSKVYVTLPYLNMLDAIESFNFKVLDNKNMIDCLFYQPREWRITSTSY
jgi:lipopolysaccharide transport system ATP-binding protein